MLLSITPHFIKYLLIITFVNFALSSPTLAKNNKKAELILDSITFTPSFVVVREKTEVKVSLKLHKDFKLTSNTRLALQQQKTLSNGRITFKSIKHLRDDGKGDDDIAGDSIYNGKIDIHPKTTDNLFFRITSKNKKSKNNKSSYPVFSLPVKNACGPTASILPVTILSPSLGKPYKPSIEFNVPGSDASPRETILRIVNGAAINAPIKNRMNRTSFSLNKIPLLRLKKSANVIEIPIHLEQGLNTLKLNKLRGNPKQKIAVEITACADQIHLPLISDTLIQNKETLQSHAKVTAQGVAVKSAQVSFHLNNNLAFEGQQSSYTADNGVANANFELIGIGNGQLTASVTESSPLLSTSQPIHVVNKASIKLNQGYQSITLAPGESKKLPYFLFYLPNNSITQHIDFDTTIKDAQTNIILTPSSIPSHNIAVNKPSSFVFEPSITAKTIGDYILTARATIIETGESYSSTTKIHVTNQETIPENFNINSLGLSPSTISPTISTTVNIHALIEGTTTPPLNLLLDEVDSQGNIIKSGIAVLTDQGSNGDNIANDYIYTAAVTFNRPTAQTILLRTRAQYSGQEITSSISSLLVTPFDTQSSAPDFNELIEDSISPDPVFSNELLVQIIAETHPDRISEIASSINGIVLNVIPQLNLYRIQFTSNGSLENLEQAILVVKSFSEVLSISKNSLVEIAGSSCSATECPVTDPNNQWHLIKTKAREAWNAAKEINSTNYAGSANNAVAVIDFGLDCTHPDLSDACFPIDSGTGTHGSEVAHIIATGDDGLLANTTGVAWNTTIYSYVIDSSFSSLLNAITRAGDNPAVKVINLSVTKLIFNSQTTAIQQMRLAICHAVTNGKLIVAAVGQPTNIDKDLYPAKLNDDNNYQCPGSDFPLSSRILAVGASDRNDKQAKWNSNTLQSNNVPWVDIYAPGIEIKAFSSLNSGTSFATPQVSAAAALLWPVMPGNPNASDIHDRILLMSDNINALSNTSTDKRLNIYNSIPQTADPISKSVTINFVTEDADYRNLFGIYNTSSLEATILIDNVDLNSNPDVSGFQTTLILTEQELNNLAFFLIPNGYSVNQNYLQNTSSNDRDLRVAKDSNNIYHLIDDSQGIRLKGTNADALFSQNTLNLGGHPQVIGSNNDTSTDFNLNWEDIPFNSSDKDYNDAIFRVTIATE